MSTMDADTGFLRISLFMLVLGVGIGLCMQVLVIIVQNTSDYRDLGVATSGVTFFRTLGSSFGAAAFGAIYAGKLEDALPAAFAQSPGLAPEDAATPALLHSQPADVIAPVVDAYADVLQSVFLYAAPVGIVAFLLSLMLPQVPLRDAARAGAGDMGDGFAMAEGGDPDRALEKAVGRLMHREGRRNLPADPPGVRYPARRSRGLVRGPGAAARATRRPDRPRHDRRRRRPGAGQRPPARVRPDRAVRVPHR